MNKKDTIIDTYTVPKHSDDLATRIIIAARKMDQKQTVLQKIQGLFYKAPVPAISFSFASVLMIGLILGNLVYKTIDIPTTSDLSASLYTYDDLFDEGSNDLLVL